MLRGTAPCFERGTELFRLIRYPLGIHYTSSARIALIMESGLLPGESGRLYVGSVSPFIADRRLKYDTVMRRSRNREIRYLMWLSHFALPKAEEDDSTPAMVVLYAEKEGLCGVEDYGEDDLAFSHTHFLRESVPPEDILTYVSLDAADYERLKRSRTDEHDFRNIQEFFAEEPVSGSLPIAVSARLFREFYQQFMYGRLVNPRLE